jgi:hypothetical protein
MSPIRRRKGLGDLPRAALTGRPRRAKRRRVDDPRPVIGIIRQGHPGMMNHPGMVKEHTQR